MTGVCADWPPADPSADVPERQSCGQTFDPLFLDILFDKKGFDGGSRIAAASLNHGRDISFHGVIGACCLKLFGHRALLYEL
ncbi:hypothetical protein AA309_10885 [Microvirga vignae]|uniref:Uncharacterized protein n=1 Tax=Microvirga vignae TaxID=1225564 RepID=A0A0H1RCY5_9HYPH|nr:hypothetical protein AA309_10885 [Microvirga vignae]